MRRIERMDSFSAVFFSGFLGRCVAQVQHALWLVVEDEGLEIKVTCSG